MKNILFVCSGNTCRSPMAEAICNDMLDKHCLFQIDAYASSAGTSAGMGERMSVNAQRALERLGIQTAKGHRATLFSLELAQKADLILAMQEHHLEEIMVIAPMLKKQAHTLKGFAAHVDGLTGSNQYDIMDPFGGCLGEYKECAAEIRYAVQGILERLKREWSGEPADRI